MQKILASTLLCASLACGGAWAQTTGPASHIGRRDSTPEDIAAITQVTEDFRSALTGKNSKLLSTLVLNSNILFSSPASPGMVGTVRDKTDIHFDGIRSGGYAGFAEFIGNSPAQVEEKFYNIKIVQDGHLAWVMFDFEFLKDNKIENYGVESWQMLKAADGKWKIFSVVWSSHGAPK